MMLAVLILALFGLAIAIYLRSKVGAQGPVACPLGQDCKAVIESKFGRLFGVRNEILGILFYGAVIVAGIFSYFAPSAPWSLLIFLGSLPAALMSVALSLIQIVKLKAYCSWCLGTNAINVAIAIISGMRAL